MQQEYFGIGSINKLKEILKKEQPNNVFLVTGKNSYFSSNARKKLETILFRYQHIRFFDFSTNPKIEDVEKGIEIYKRKRCDLVIAIGGGSVIDVAKSINAFSFQTGNPKDYVKGKLKLLKKGNPLVAIPTTTGTGSEATHFAVVYINKVKYSLAHHHILPDYSIIDPSLTFNLSKKITAVTGMDVLAQAIESYWSINSSETSKKYAREAIQLVLDNLEKAVNHPTINSRVMMAKAANLAGKAINISKTTACHAISYPLTSYFGIPHGHAVALTLGEMFVYNYQVTDEDCLDSRGSEYVKMMMSEILDDFKIKTAEEFNIIFKRMLNNIGLKGSLNDLGIFSEDINSIIENGLNLERVKNNPRQITEGDLRKILNNIR